MSEISFNQTFCKLTANPPFPWQKSLYEKFMAGEIPASCDLPTGLGKTSVIAIWLIALANGASMPRRLAYVVNRRTVVDQTTTEVEKIRRNIEVSGIGDGLRLLRRIPTKKGEPSLAISTLRGQFADNREWSADPSKPAVVCGTVDMIGSRLMFSGYGVGFKGKPLHAGFLGQDTLLVHDEAHLEPAFQQLVETVEEEQRREGERGAMAPRRGLRVMALSATARTNRLDEERTPFELTVREKQPPDAIPDPPTEPIHHVWRRLKAKKALSLHEIADEKKQADQIATLALRHRDAESAVLIFVRTLDDVKKVCDKLTSKQSGVPPDHVQQLTGTMRGKERDELVKSNPVFARFMRPSDGMEVVTPTKGTVYLVCTSAGEVGVNLSADHLVCDLSTFESMAQRFGRVNRYGDRDDTHLDVVHPTKFDDKQVLTPSRKATLALLEQLNGDASPLALGQLPAKERADAFAPTPTIPPATDILFDAWALTTIRSKMPGRPPIEPFLHGIADWEPPRTTVAWRQEVDVLDTDDLLERYKPEDLLDDFQLKPHELLSDRTSRVLESLQVLAANHPKAAVWLIDTQGQVIVSTLAKVADPNATNAQAKRRLEQAIADAVVLLPPSLGSMSHGMLDGNSEFSDEIAYDVADVTEGTDERRIRVESNDEAYDEKTNGMRLVRSIELDSDEEDDTEPRTWDWYKRKPLEGGRTAPRPVLWKTHVEDVVRETESILAGLELPENIAQAIRVAAKLHDHGKRRAQFQLTLGNRDYPNRVLAKSGRAGARLPEAYRHEFGSITDAAEDAEFKGLSSEMQDLVLHLIAAHHGRARPHFPLDEAYDPDTPLAITEPIACEVPRRFARLQRRYGRWGLAYIESLLRAADWAASAEPSEFESRAKPQEVMR